MTDEIHSCSLLCDRPACIKAQRDELAALIEARKDWVCPETYLLTLAAVKVEAKRAEQAERERDIARAQIETLRDALDTCDRLKREAERERDAATQDALRYRWLRLSLIDEEASGIDRLTAILGPHIKTNPEGFDASVDVVMESETVSGAAHD